jgi:hypothetical protein
MGGSAIKPFTIVTIVVFGLVSLAHLMRMVLRWSVTVNEVDISTWVGVVGFVVPAVLAVMLYRENRQARSR